MHKASKVNNTWNIRLPQKLKQIFIQKKFLQLQIYIKLDLFGFTLDSNL